MVHRSPKYNSNRNLQKYDIILKHAEFASEQLWQIFQIFILVHTIFIALLANFLFSQFNQQSQQGDKLFSVVVPLIGVLMSLMWLGAYSRTRGYYDFRLAQANEIEPSELKLLRDRGEKFAEGDCVTIGEKCFRMNFWARWLRMKWTMPIFILSFLGFYLILLLNNLGIKISVHWII